MRGHRLRHRHHLPGTRPAPQSRVDHRPLGRPAARRPAPAPVLRDDLHRPRAVRRRTASAARTPCGMAAICSKHRRWRMSRHEWMAQHEEQLAIVIATTLPTAALTLAMGAWSWNQPALVNATITAGSVTAVLVIHIARWIGLFNWAMTRGRRLQGRLTRLSVV